MMKQCFENHSHIWQIQFYRGLGVAWISREVSVIGLGNNQRFFCAPKYYITYTKWVKAAIGVVGRSVIISRNCPYSGNGWLKHDHRVYNPLALLMGCEIV